MIGAIVRQISYACAFFCLASLAQAAPVSRERCFLPGMEDAADCVTLTVPLDWARPAAEKIQVFAAVLPALSRDSARDGFVLVPGGPGQSGDSLVGLATGAFREIRQTRDIVLIYPRGTARSVPLSCPELKDQLQTDRSKTIAWAKKCGQAQKTATAFFTSAEITRDIEELRRALGYPQLSLWGGSFGSRIVQHYARDYPSVTRLVILDAAAPAGVSIAETAPRAADAALAALDQHCKSDTQCRKQSPALAADVASILAGFSGGAKPLRITDPVTGRLTTVQVDRQLLASTIHLTLYTPQTRALLPQLIAAAKQGRFEPLLAMGATSGATLDDQISIGANFSALCAEDMQMLTAAGLARAARSFMGTRQADQLTDICAVWPHAKIASRFRQPFRSTVPALVLSGALDPITPPEGGDSAASYFRDAVHVRIPASGHISSTFSCAPRQIAQFVSTGKTSLAAWGCVQKAKPPAPLGTPNG